MSYKTWTANNKVRRIGSSWYACGQSGQVVTSSDGISWSQCTTPIVAELLDIAGVVGLIVAGGYYKVIRSTDGVNFTQVTGLPTWTNTSTGSEMPYVIQSVTVLNSTTVILGCDHGGVLISTDGGNTFAEKTISIGSTAFGMSWLTASHGFVANYGGVFETTDGGSTWVKRLDVGSQRMRKVHVGADGVGWAIGDTGLIYRSSDTGFTWSRITLAGFDLSNLNDLTVVDGSTVRIAGTDNSAGVARLIRTNDGGATWNDINPTLPNPVSNTWVGIEFENPTTGVIVYYTLTMKTTDSGKTWVRTNNIQTNTSTEAPLSSSTTTTTTTTSAGKKNRKA